MNDKEVRDYLKTYEEEVAKKYDNIEVDKIQLPSDFKQQTFEKIFNTQADEKKIDKKWWHRRDGLIKAAAVIILVGIVSFTAVKIDASIFGFDAWKTTETDKDSDGNVEIAYNKNEKTKEHGADKAKERKNDFPEYIPAGFKVGEKNIGDNLNYQEYEKDKNYLFYSRAKISKDAKYYGKDVEGKKVSVAGYVGYIYKEQGERRLQWRDDKYINTIGTDDDIDESELFRMAESLY